MRTKSYSPVEEFNPLHACQRWLCTLLFPYCTLSLLNLLYIFINTACLMIYTMFLNLSFQGSTPNHNTGYNDSQLVVPDHGNFQEDLSESSNSSSVESSPRGMDPELNNTWVEEETTPYSFSKYPPAVVSSSQSMTPQTATLQSSEADFFDHYFNGQTNTEHTNVEEQVSALLHKDM